MSTHAACTEAEYGDSRLLTTGCACCTLDWQTFTSAKAILHSNYLSAHLSQTHPVSITRFSPMLYLFWWHLLKHNFMSLN